MSVLENLMNSNILTSIAKLFSTSILSSVVSFVSMLLISDYLGADDFGKYSLVFLISSTLVVVFNFGFPIANIYFYAKEPDTIKLDSINFFFNYHFDCCSCNV